MILKSNVQTLYAEMRKTVGVIGGICSPDTTLHSSRKASTEEGKTMQKIVMTMLAAFLSFGGMAPRV